MAIYHLQYNHICRKKGQSACVAASYQSGSKIFDQRLGKTHNYSRKEKVDHTEILAPSVAPEWVSDRASLWNAVERNDKRYDARPASEILVALPKELNQEQQKELVKNFVNDNLIDRGLIADLGFHNLEENNPHCHILFTTSKINEQGFGKKDRSLKGKEFLKSIREKWSAQVNEALAKAGINETIDHRSLQERGIDRIPQIHLGAKVWAMEARGIQTERGDQLREIKAANARIQTLQEKKKSLEAQLDQLTGVGE